MTKAAKVYGKDLSNFMRSPETLEYISALSVISTDKEIVQTQRGSGLLPQVGTWGHPKLAVFFARWLDVKFAVFCDMVIDDILNKKAELVVTKPEESAATLTMSSREIAELTGKLHKNVMADTRKMLEELGYQPTDFSARYIDGKGESRECFNLPKDLTITLVSGYNITKRWMELEAQLNVGH